MAQAFANLQSKLVSQLTVHHLLKHGPDAYNIAVRIFKADTEMMEELRGLFEVRHAFDSHLPAPPPAAPSWVPLSSVTQLTPAATATPAATTAPAATAAPCAHGGEGVPGLPPAPTHLRPLSASPSTEAVTSRAVADPLVGIEL